MQEHPETADVACSLNDDAFRRRREMARRLLGPHLVGTEKLASGIRLSFSETLGLRAQIERFVSLERQCCGFLTFTIGPPSPELTLTIEGPPEARETLALFVAAAEGR